MCNITVSPLTGQVASGGQDVAILTVSGSAADCQAVVVKVIQTQPVNFTTPEKNAPVSNGQWEVDFEVSAGDFPAGTFFCGRANKFVVEAVCVDDPSCGDTFADDLINCDSCPEVTLTASVDACINGRRTVHFIGEVLSSGDATYTWFFGTDEDNQPGEDSQAGDGNGNIWLPLPNANGVRVVETDHVYEPGQEAQTITVRLVTSAGPNGQCTAQQTFTLEPCRCDMTVTLLVLDSQGEDVSDEDCLPPGDYQVAVSSPTGNDLDYSWSLNGASDDSQNGSSFNFAIASGEEKTISVFVEQGNCDGSSAVVVEGCADCRDYQAGLAVLDEDQGDVTSEDCLSPGSYTVQVTEPSGTGNVFSWSLNNQEVPETGDSLSIELGEEDQQLVTLEASRGECRDTVSVVLNSCPPENDDDDDTSDGFIPCLLFKLLALLGLGLVFLGAILTLCPAVAMPFPAQVAVAIGVGLMIGGAVIFLLGLLLWVIICQPDGCDWLTFLWQTLILLGLLMIYAGLCPVCSWLLLGVVPLIAGAGLSVVWGRNCNPTRCRVLSEWISLFTFVVNVVVILEMVLAACVITSHPVASIIWGLMIAAIQGWLWFEANRSNCIRG